MKFVCEKNLLASAVDGASRAITNRSAIPVLDGLLLKAEGFSLTLTGYDTELSITTTIESNVIVPGEMVLNAKLLGEMVRRMPSGEVTITLEDSGMATVKGGVAEFELNAMLSNEYPTLPVSDATEACPIKVGLLREMIEKTIFAVSQDERKPAHTGELVVIEPQQLSIVALDGYRLAIVERPMECSKDIRVIVPAKTMQEVNRLMGDDEEKIVHFYANRRFVVFEVNNYRIMSRLIEGEFLNYQGVIPQGCRTRAKVNCREFISSIERASLIITERLKNPLRITFEKGRVIVRCQTTLGKVVDEIPADVQGDSIEIGFNNRYLLDALRNSKVENMIFEMSGSLSPVKLLSEEGNDFTYMVLPVRFKND